jgi:1,4-dihydroxy-2-naphthoate octaprenyltransferase
MRPESIRSHELATPLRTVLSLAGVRYWTAPLLPVLVGTTLPLWLRPPGYSFRWIGAFEFGIGALLMYAGFSLLLAHFKSRSAGVRRRGGILGGAVTCIVAASVLGLHLMRLTPHLIFVVYGLSVLFAGLLCVAPPAQFLRHPGGEVVLSLSLGLLPVLGAYLVQTGDLTRTVYVAALPVYAAVLLWVWMEQMSVRKSNDEARSQTLADDLGARLSGRLVVPGISLLLCASIVVAVQSSSVMPLALAALPVLFAPLWRIVITSWSAYDDPSGMRRAAVWALVAHAALCFVLVASSLAAALV